MEIARVLAKHQPKSTIILGAVSGEEQGLYGSTYLAQTLKNSSTNVEGMLNCDIVGSSTGDRGQKDPIVRHESLRASLPKLLPTMPPA